MFDFSLFYGGWVPHKLMAAGCYTSGCQPNSQASGMGQNQFYLVFSSDSIKNASFLSITKLLFKPPPISTEIVKNH